MKYFLIFLLLFSTAFAQRVGEEAYSFNLSNDEGELITLDEFKGKPILLNFWASWCPPCIEELPMFQELDQKLNSAEEVVLNIVLVNTEEQEHAIPFLREKLHVELENAAFAATSLQTVMYRNQGVEMDSGGKLTRKYRLRGLPTTMIIDADGIVQDIWIGFLTAGKVKQLLAKVGVEVK